MLARRLFMLHVLQMATEHFQWFADMRGWSVQHECDMLAMDVPLTFALSRYSDRWQFGWQ
jgi:hypothetical protein